MRIQVPSGEAQRQYEFPEKSGKFYSEQTAAIFAGGHYPIPFTVSAPKGSEYPAGEYTLDPSSFAVNERGKLVLKSVRLLATNGSSLNPGPKK